MIFEKSSKKHNIKFDRSGLQLLKKITHKKIDLHKVNMYTNTGPPKVYLQIQPKCIILSKDFKKQKMNTPPLASAHPPSTKRTFWGSIVGSYINIR